MLRSRFLGVVAGSLGVVACGSSLLGGGSDSLTARAPEAPGGQAKCKVAASAENPLVTEWPAPEKANLEARLREGGVMVSYAGCEMKLLPQCRVRGSYGWRRTTTTTDLVEIRDADELYAKLPLGAVALEGELARSGRLAVQTTVAGQLELRGWDRQVPEDPACAGATHVVGALSVGAFKLRAGGSIAAQGGVGFAGLGTTGGGTQSSETVLREAGSPDACQQSTDENAAPECRSPIQVFLWPLPKELADRGAPGTVKVTFLSGNPEHEYDVAINDRTLCSTPCARWVDPAVPFTFVHETAWYERNERIVMPDLREHQTKGNKLDARAFPTKTGKLAGGIVMTTFGGIGVLAGVSLTAVGAAREDGGGLLAAGLITLPIGMGLTAPGILMIVNSASRVEIEPANPGAPPRLPVEARARDLQVGVGGAF
ncbi:MAG: hypothetical protein OZ921_15615 [Sorangiineae bacterium]|nr:hypothetical protein [Polyangiaceae bacterium]MEB2323939.1 hypothetical protein [Sorangiineae bacterium]